jgi:hypothetical protein
MSVSRSISVRRMASQVGIAQFAGRQHLAVSLLQPAILVGRNHDNALAALIGNRHGLGQRRVLIAAEMSPKLRCGDRDHVGAFSVIGSELYRRAGNPSNRAASPNQSRGQHGDGISRGDPASAEMGAQGVMCNMVARFHQQGRSIDEVIAVGDGSSKAKCGREEVGGGI